jgi:hypothetical protein
MMTEMNGNLVIVVAAGGRKEKVKIATSEQDASF